MQPNMRPTFKITAIIDFYINTTSFTCKPEMLVTMMKDFVFQEAMGEYYSVTEPLKYP